MTNPINANGGIERRRLYLAAEEPGIGWEQVWDQLGRPAGV